MSTQAARGRTAANSHLRDPNVARTSSITAMTTARELRRQHISAFPKYLFISRFVASSSSSSDSSFSFCLRSSCSCADFFCCNCFFLPVTFRIRLVLGLRRCHYHHQHHHHCRCNRMTLVAFACERGCTSTHVLWHNEPLSSLSL